MFCFDHKKFFSAGLLVFSITSCNQNLSVHNAFVRSDDSTRMDQLIQESKARLDEGKIDEATKIAIKAYKINPKIYSLNIHLAYLYLAKAGMDPMSLLKKLLGDLSTSAKDPNAGASSLLDSFGSLAQISASDFTAMTDTSKYDDGTSDPKYFSDIPIPAPAKPADIRGSVPALIYINKIIALTCPYIPTEGLRKDFDDRHNCTSTDTSDPGFGSEKAGLLFALAHVAEAAIFQRVVLYKSQTNLALSATSTTTTTTTSLSNLFSRAQKINSGNVTLSEITDYVHAVATLKTNVDDVFDTDSSSMFAVMLSNLKSSSNALAHITGIPESFVKPITDAVDSIISGANTIATAEGSSGAIPAGTDSNLIALKKQLNGTMAAEMKTSISNVLSNPQNASISAEQKTSICDSYKSIANSTINLPTGC